MSTSTAFRMWRIPPEKVEAAIERIVETADPLKIILFGSYVRGRSDENSDLDILVVVEDRVKSAREEAVRIRRALRGICTVDILVVSVTRWEELRDVPGLVYREILKTGRVVYERAA